MGFLPGVAGALLSFGGTIEQGQAEANAAHFNAAVASNNARYASEAGTAQATAESEKNADALGHIRASQGANNVDVNSGSAVKVQQSAREIGNVDTQNVENNALLAAYGYKEQAMLDNQQGAADTEGAAIGATGTLLSQVTQLAGTPGAGGSSGSDADSGGDAAAAGG